MKNSPLVSVNKMHARLNSMTLDAVKEVAIGLFKRTSDASATAFEVVLAHLEQRMNEKAFVAWCDSSF